MSNYRGAHGKSCLRRRCKTKYGWDRRRQPPMKQENHSVRSGVLCLLGMGRMSITGEAKKTFVTRLYVDGTSYFPHIIRYQRRGFRPEPYFHRSRAATRLFHEKPRPLAATLVQCWS